MKYDNFQRSDKLLIACISRLKDKEKMRVVIVIRPRHGFESRLSYVAFCTFVW